MVVAAKVFGCGSEWWPGLGESSSYLPAESCVVFEYLHIIISHTSATHGRLDGQVRQRGMTSAPQQAPAETTEEATGPRGVAILPSSAVCGAAVLGSAVRFFADVSFRDVSLIFRSANAVPANVQNLLKFGRSYWPYGND